MSYFENCKNIDEAKKQYKILAKQMHPDQGGDDELFKELQKQYENFLKFTANRAFSESKKYDYDSDDVGFLAKILREIIDFDIDIEIIGTWIYCKNSYDYRDILKSKGFWYSGKHKAWIFSGEAKRKIRTKLSVEEVKNKYGCEQIKSSNARKRIGA